MIDVKRDFQERVNEIDLYFTFIEKIILKDSSLLFRNGRKEKIDADLSQILRANGFLLLYNLVESCIKKSIEEIYFSIRRNGIKYDDVKDGIKKEIIKYLRSDKISPDTFILLVNDIAQDIVEHCFSSERIFSGNVDAKKIRDAAAIYGFSTKTDKRKTKGGINLLTVKNRRNGLAHGDYSFRECGKDYTIQDMIKIKKEVTVYLKQILDNIENYINNFHNKILIIFNVILFSII